MGAGGLKLLLKHHHDFALYRFRVPLAFDQHPEHALGPDCARIIKRPIEAGLREFADRYLLLI
jgi:hypothetical protein